MRNLSISVTCNFCKKDHVLQVANGDFNKFQKGEHIQDVMPYLTPEDRELLISGICGTCFDDIFAGGDEE